jgi:hypothetical protein
MSSDAALDPIRALVDTVLYEGYVLYPYGARSDKNQVRFQWGVLGPPGSAEEGACESPSARVECVVAADPTGEVEVTVRFLQLQRRTVERAEGDGFVEVDELTVDEQLLLAWDEAVEREIRIGPVAPAALLGRAHTEPIDEPAGEELEEIRAADGSLRGRLRRRRWPLTGQVRVAADVGDLDGSLWRLAVEVHNTAPWEPGGTREHALRQALVATHVVLHGDDVAFVSSQDPPARAAEAVAACRSERLWPVLVGDPGSHDTVLAAPIILYDHPELAPESPGDYFDATEIDELLTLRVMTLTDDEKREARATDPRAAAIIDRADTLPPEILERLHGAVRSVGPRIVDSKASPDVADPRSAFDRDPDVPWWDPAADADVSPGSDGVVVDGVTVAAGSHVRLAPSRRADAQDLFVAGRTATVQAVVFDVDGGTHLAVTVDDDPAADLHDWYGRYLYFAPDEVEPLDEEPSP